MIKQMKAQRGQSTVEFAIVAAALVPFILAVGLIAKMSDIQHSTAQASQYAVWEKTSGPAKTPKQLEDEVRARFFTQTSRALVNKDKVADTASDDRPYWVDHGGRRLLKKFSSVSNAVNQTGLAPAQTYFNIGAPLILDGMGLNQDGFWRSTISAPLEKQPSDVLGPFKQLVFSPQGSAALLADGWTAYNKGSVRKAMDDIRVTASDFLLMDAVRLMAEGFNIAGMDADPSSFENRNVDHDVVPCEFRINTRKKNAC